MQRLGLILLVCVVAAIFALTCSSSTPDTIADRTCEDLQPKIVKLSEDNKNPMARTILKLYEVTEVERTEDKLTCYAVARWNRGDDSPIEFYVEEDADGDTFIGYGTTSATPTPEN